jgi:S-sulfo-L-cysteine synthase (O-acetyl-L-serine-dependent)
VFSPLCYENDLIKTNFMNNLDHEMYRNSLAFELHNEKNLEERRKLLKAAQSTNAYGEAKQLHAEDVGRELSPERQEIYDSLTEKIGNTPLVKYEGEVPDGNEIFLKLECDNQLGHSHYDRVYLKLFYEKEKLGIIHPGDNVFETSSGSAGISFAALGGKLGYKCHVAIPAGGEKAREQSTIAQGAQIYLTPAEKYINGFKRFISDFSKEHPDYIFLNHSMGNILGKGSDVNENAVASMEDIADEAINQLKEQGGEEFDFIISAMGNGTNTLGISQEIQKISPQTKVIGFEMMSSAAAFQKKYPGKYEELLDVNKNGNVKPENFSRHHMPGTSFPGIKFPAFNRSINLIDGIELVTDNKTNEEYKKMAGTENDPQAAIRWDDDKISEHLKEFGRSTKAGVAVALKKLSEIGAANEKVLVIAYDRANRYDTKE